MLQIEVATTTPDQVTADALAVVCFELPESETAASPQAANTAPPSTLDPNIAQGDGWLAELRASREFTGKLYETAILHRPPGLAAKRLIVIGGGKRAKFTTFELRRIGGVLARTAKSKGVRHLAVLVEDPMDTAEGVIAVAEGAFLGAWEADKYKTDPKKSEKQLDTVTIACPALEAKTLEHAVQQGVILGRAQNLARDLANEPANHLTPAVLVEAARRVAAEHGLGCEVLDQEAMNKLGMGALLGVAQGSDNPPFLIALQYRPSVNTKNDHLALVGKGVTFDTGGISIKPADGMERMKYDMSGAAATVAAMQAIAQLKPSIPVTGYIPTVENMVNGHAQRPGDVVTSMAGKTIEVINTDAEGRLILADAITYAIRNGATHLVDAATLTGAIVVALGNHYMGAFTNSPELLQRFFASAKTAGEKVWQMPLEEEYKDALRSPFADLANVGGRPGGSITAAWFIREFADPTPWIHLDIASTAWLDEPKAWSAKGPTGVCVRSFVQLALDWKSTS